MRERDEALAGGCARLITNVAHLLIHYGNSIYNNNVDGDHHADGIKMMIKMKML